MTEMSILISDTNTDEDIQNLHGTVSGWLVLDAVGMMNGEDLGYAEFIPDSKENGGRCPYELGVGGMVQFHISMEVPYGDVSRAVVKLV